MVKWSEMVKWYSGRMIQPVDIGNTVRPRVHFRNAGPLPDRRAPFRTAGPPVIFTGYRLPLLALWSSDPQGSARSDKEAREIVFLLYTRSGLRE